MNARPALAAALRALVPHVGQLLEAAADVLESAPSTVQSAAPEWIALHATGLPLKSVRNAIGAGELAARRIGREYFVRRHDLDQRL